MTAYNVVRFRVKPGKEDAFVDYHKNRTLFEGMDSASLIKTGDRTFCLIGQWQSMDKLAAARAEMISTLDGFRDWLEDLGGGLGVTDAVSGTVVTEMARPS